MTARDVGAQAVFVGAGGAVGSLARHALALAVPPGASGWPSATLLANVLGALLLGLLLAVLGRRTGGRARALRLALGTGLLGGFTTASALGLEVVGLAGRSPVLAVAYAVVSAVGGLVAAVAGGALGRRLPGPRRR